MRFNPFEEKPMPLDQLFMDWDKLYPKPYHLGTVHPYTKVRIVLMNGTEFEAQWFGHQFSRHCQDNDLRRELAMIRRIEQMQQKRISCLKPKNETVLEHTITYEQLAVDLTAFLARRENDCNVKTALDFALLEDFDHLYRYANLLDYEYGTCPEKLVGRYTEMTPARPTIAHHRYPTDSIFRSIDNQTASLKTKLGINIITAAEQQTMNYYMNNSSAYLNDAGRKLYQEISLVEEEHVTQYGSLIDVSAHPLACLLWHEFAECYLYWSNAETETDKQIRKLWQSYFETELSHLHAARKLVRKYLKKDYDEIIPDPVFPEPLSLHENVAYVRKILSSTVQFTGDLEDYKDVSEIGEGDRFFAYHGKFCAPLATVPSRKVIKDYIARYGEDYRYETAEHPIAALRSRTKDNEKVGYDPGAAESKGFDPN